MREKAAALQGDGITRAEKQQYIITLSWSFGSMGAGWFCSWRVGLWITGQYHR
jgi:hypothetical protein